ncbi:phage terminase large subunit family protein [Falsiroseomonas sp. CW058]|uniref:phage terminase large subunit family protein n=1 Tax=Falsiroseomonas sp. CW058 TaxID=3388664 RepID=UPI003D32391E
MSSSSSRPSANPKPISAPATKADRLRQAARRGWTPPPRISVPEWADRYRQLAKEAGARSGRWDTGTVEVARGPMLAVTEPGVHVITVMVCTQLLKTALLENVFGYHAHLDPCPMLLLQPKEAAAEQFSKERITPMVRATPVLRDLVGTSSTRSADETLLFKSFPGGFLALAGAGSPDNLARRPIRILLSDEVDKYPVTREGEPIAIAEERTASFDTNWLSIRACSPTVEDESRIAASYDASDQRRASLACPHCGHRQFPDFFRHVQWEKDGPVHRPETARIHCDSCSRAWSEGERLRALRTARWHQTRPFTCCGIRQSPIEAYNTAWRHADVPEPERTGRGIAAAWDWWAGPRHAVYRARCATCGTWPVNNHHAGFQAGKLYSPWQKDRPQDIAAKWLLAQGDEDRKQVWWNTQAGLPYRPTAGKAVVLDALLARAETWAGEVPHGVALLTAGIDVQHDRVEVEIVGWGRHEESWSVAQEVIEGDPDTDALWDRVDALLLRRFHREDGRPFRIEAACIDTGGHSTQKVYSFCKARLGRKVWGIKGESARNGTRSPVWPTKRPTAATRSSYRPIIIGVNAAKDVVRNRLALETPGPGFMHVPAERDVGWYQQLLAERLVKKSVGAVTYRVWEPIPGRANEALDCRVYAYAALCGLIHFGLRLNARADAAASPHGSAGEDATAAVATAPPPPADAVPTALTGPVVLPQPAPAVSVRVAGQDATRNRRASRYAR